jgi:predicted AAA+ superfamily ATPase
LRHADKLVILDEVQSLPGLFGILRGLIDKGRRCSIIRLLGRGGRGLLSRR